jgi:hypothetical protein
VISEQKISVLRAAYARGRAARSAAGAAGVSYPTALSYFRQFREAGLPRGYCHPHRGRCPDPPHYIGPDWIGEAIG